MAMIADAFHRTDLAVPALAIQPPDNRTLVTLPTYFAVDWPREDSSRKSGPAQPARLVRDGDHHQAGVAVGDL